MTTQNLQDTEKAVLRGSSQQYGLPKKDRKILNLTLHLKELDEQQQTQLRENRRKEIIKIRAELNDIETKKSIQTMNPGAGSLKK